MSVVSIIGILVALGLSVVTGALAYVDYLGGTYSHAAIWAVGSLSMAALAGAFYQMYRAASDYQGVGK